MQMMLLHWAESKEALEMIFLLILLNKIKIESEETS